LGTATKAALAPWPRLSHMYPFWRLIFCRLFHGSTAQLVWPKATSGVPAFCFALHTLRTLHLALSGQYSCFWSALWVLLVPCSAPTCLSLFQDRTFSLTYAETAARSASFQTSTEQAWQKRPNKVCARLLHLFHSALAGKGHAAEPRAWPGVCLGYHPAPSRRAASYLPLQLFFRLLWHSVL